MYLVKCFPTKVLRCSRAKATSLTVEKLEGSMQKNEKLIENLNIIISLIIKLIEENREISKVLALTMIHKYDSQTEEKQNQNQLYQTL